MVEAPTILVANILLILMVNTNGYYIVNDGFHDNLVGG